MIRKGANHTKKSAAHFEKMISTVLFDRFNRLQQRQLTATTAATANCTIDYFLTEFA
jgi:hypothetical protein